ncbi:hypothetical protein AUEXF2481DRAFT_1729 [Aureobasidium subglaciale EXF-2481]|uniref:Uncharacterized protein n=1 Tax=Aureobasidium subglaciale (strain EXF-2481) TaxID=1043005 RepID=A0A074YM42_AURSE|nr:uncharacterized protein AUEXF2481DRAFT_1729 [Aureobasidium subglaciale EXF-2481]KEQ98898.1 hypothetical protein AUEXF2481DRAFT_1729 [Aureobasidium subglaciale EXF-2481]
MTPRDVHARLRYSVSLPGETSHDQELARAVLDLRQWESSKTAERMRHLVSDRDHSRAETISLSSQLNYMEDWIMGLYVSYSVLPSNELMIGYMWHLICSIPRLRGRVVQDEQAYQSLEQSVSLYGADAEVLLLRQQLQARCAENERLKSQINAQVEGRMDEVFDSAVRLAVEHERGKDEVVIKDLRQENQRLRVALETQTRSDC